MKSFKVYTHPVGKTEVVKIGWSWPGFLFAPFWALVKKLWLHAAIMWGIIIFCSFLASTVEEVNGYDFASRTLDTVSRGLGVTFAIVCGIKGNKARQDNLLSRGYVESDVIIARSPEDAIAVMLTQTDKT